MAVWKVKDVDGHSRSLPWGARINVKGGKSKTKMFETEAEAIAWETDYKDSLLKPPTVEKNTILVRTLVEKFRDDKILGLDPDGNKDLDLEPDKRRGGWSEDEDRLNAFLRRDICNKSLADVTTRDGKDYMDARLKEKSPRTKREVSPSTVRREIALLRTVFEYAKDRLELEFPVNPFSGISMKGKRARRSRKRRVLESEILKLKQTCEEICRGANKHYIPLAMDLVLETGMRLQECLWLEWGDFDFDDTNRRIYLRKTKMDYTRERDGCEIVMSPMALWLLVREQEYLFEQGKTPTGRVFPMSKKAAKRTFAKLVRKAGLNGLSREGIKGLHFHDLRHEAASRWVTRKPELQLPEVSAMLNHADKSITEGYILIPLSHIQEKLDMQAVNLWNKKVPTAVAKEYEAALSELMAKPPLLLPSKSA